MRNPLIATTVSLLTLAPATVAQHGHGHERHGKAAAPQPAQPAAGHGSGTRTKSRALPALPKGLPSWLSNTDTNHIYRKRGVYNDDIYNIPKLAYDLNAVAVGHAMAYEDLVTGKAAGLETDTFSRIDRVLKNPPRLMPDERFLSPTFGRRYGVLEQVFDWTHILHAQIVDVLASTEMTQEQKDAEVERIYRYYRDSVSYAITPLPMNMAFLDGQPYSTAFRQKYPKVNGLFWGYHWLQGAMHDILWGKSLEAQRRDYDEAAMHYHSHELYRTDRPFMPMFAEVSPRFAQRYPHISNTFDNLHMLHDMVNDILASEWMTEAQKNEQIKRAIWLVSAKAHKGEKPGDAKEPGGLHDHRFMEGMPGMGLMPAGAHSHEGHGGHDGHPQNGSTAPPAGGHGGHNR